MARLLSCLTLVTVAGCVSAPTTFSARSAASVETAAAPRVAIGRALTEEPPAPGASTDGWAGLAAPTTTDAMPMHHHHHPGMTMPMPESSDAQ
jgi:hypothetical protein